MTTQRKYPLTELSAAVAPARTRHRALIEAAGTWQAGRERQICPDHFALICAVADDERGCEDVTPTRWTRTTVYGTVRCDIPNWCSIRRTLWPEQTCQAMWDWFTFLSETGRLDPRSDPLAELCKPLACYGWLDERGRQLPPDAERVIECECFLPYRDTAALLGELVRRCELSGEDPLQVLRHRITAPAPRWEPWVLGDDGDELDAYGPVDQ